MNPVSEISTLTTADSGECRFKGIDVAGQRVIIGLSGGVDSAVAAALLKQQGADVHALHMTNWDDDDGYCTAARDLHDARQICDQIGIPMHHVNFAREYRERVFGYFLDEYAAGRTPNPDVLCNREIKFGTFREHAKRLGGQLTATGHYARVRVAAGVGQLYKAKDVAKDQSYFLHAVAADAFETTVFPLGDLLKVEVRLIARDLGLDVYSKKDSTGICFIGERPFREFLATYLPANPGPIRTVDGNEVGRHHGLMYYTLGQRQGLGIGGRADVGDEPWYVIERNVAENTLIVVQGDDSLLYSNHLEASMPCWIGAVPAEIHEAGTMTCSAKIRYRQADQQCHIQLLGGSRLAVTFENPQRAIAPGQYIVFYDGDRCLGGAVIDNALPARAAFRTAV